MKYWAGLFAEIDKEQLEKGVATMLKAAKELLATQQRWDGEGRQLEFGNQQKKNNNNENSA